MSFPPPANQAIFGAATMRRSPDIDINRDYEGVGVCQDVASLVCVMVMKHQLYLLSNQLESEVHLTS